MRWAIFSRMRPRSVVEVAPHEAFALWGGIQSAFDIGGVGARNLTEGFTGDRGHILEVLP